MFTTNKKFAQWFVKTFFCVGIYFSSVSINCQNYIYTQTKEGVLRESAHNVKHSIELNKKENLLTASNHITFIKNGLVSLVRFLPKLIYKPNKYISENQTSFKFFNNEQGISTISKDLELIFSVASLNDDTDKPTKKMGNFIFEFGSYKENKGYYFLGLTSFELSHTLVKLKPKSNKVHLILEVLFEYYDSNNTKKEFVLEPFYIDYVQVPQRAVFQEPNYQLLPKMEVLESVTVKITEINTKKEQWDKWLGLYEKHQGKIPEILN
jgi:hypothetical protein